MLETSIQMVLHSQTHNVLKVGVVDVCVDSEKALEYHLNRG
jgi:hypothetical protein